MLGQVAANDQDQWVNAVVELRQTDVPPRTSVLDDLGAFRFEDVLIGATAITLTSPHNVIVRIPNFTLVV